jgi:hypothetical protein
MAQQDFGVAVIPAMAGFLFWKRAKVQEIQEVKASRLPAVIKTGETGVTRYLMSTPLVTTVAKYMKKNEKQSITGVAKYVLRQSIAERNAPPPTGVAKYLVNAAKQPSGIKKSGVAKYLAKQELAAPNMATLTGVARYEAEQALMARKKAAAAMIQKFKEDEEAAALKAANEATEAAYESYSLAVTEEEQAAEAPAATRVGQYLQQQAELYKKRPKATSVSKYIANKIALDSQKPTETISKVSKYLRQQALAESKKPSLTGVAKYLSKQKAVVRTVKPKENHVESGVARYLVAQAIVDSNKPSLSGVAKYLEKQAYLEQSNRLRLPDYRLEQVEDVAEKCLEGEFIPAGDFKPVTGVSRYLEKHDAVVAVSTAKAAGSSTGVSRYLDKQVKPSHPTQVSAPTSVDRYLLNRAA